MAEADLGIEGNIRLRSPQWLNWIPMVLGAIIALSFMQWICVAVLVKLEAAALGTATEFVNTEANGASVQCMDASDSEKCVAGYQRAGKPPAVLWLGNSQLAAINRLKAGDRAAPGLLHEALRARGIYQVTYAVPNANLLEHALQYSALAGQYDTRALILPVFLDDIREQGIREPVAGLLDDPGVRSRVELTTIWPLISGSLHVNNALHSKSDATETRQKWAERMLNEKLGAWWPLWQQRANMRGIVGIVVHELRNKILGINAQTKRRVDPGVYREKMTLLTAILAETRARNIKVLLYVPPFRLDIPHPYFDDDYGRLKRDLQALALQYGARFANLESIVPGPEWGMVVNAITGLGDYDFMHFTAEGHRRHATAIDVELRAMGF